MPSPSDRARAQSRLFQLLAFGFSHPKVENAQLMLGGGYPALLREVTETLYGEAIDINVADIEFDDFESQYIDLFQVGNAGRPAVCLHAGDYDTVSDGRSRPELLLEYSNWYKHFGLKVKQDDEANELPDHIVCQLEFLAWLAHLQVQALLRSEPESGYLLAQRDFIQRQMKPFFREFINSLVQETEKRNSISFFRELGKLAGLTLERYIHECNSTLGISGKKMEPPVGNTSPAKSEPVHLWS